MENFANGIKHYNTVLCSIGNPSTKEVCGYPSDEVDDSLPLCSRHRKLINETFREQIAKEIVAYHNDPKSCHKDYRHCECEVYLAIARGEPNQVTKDAIEEARKMNGEKLGWEK